MKRYLSRRFGRVSTSPVACSPHDRRTHARPLQAGCRRARARRRDRRPHRAQGPQDRRARAAHARRRHGEAATTPSTTASPSSTIWSRSSRARRWSRWSSRDPTRGRSCARMMGTTNPREAAPGTIRGDLADRAHRESRARKRRSGVGCARDRAVLSRVSRERFRRLSGAGPPRSRRVARLGFALVALAARASLRA